MADLFTIQAHEAKKLFKEYSQFKNLYSTSPTPENEIRLKETLTSFLNKVLEVCKELEAKTESRGERDLLKQFALELKEIFK